MKIIWSLKSIPEFEGLDKSSAKEAWMKMFWQVRANGDCKYAPIACGGVYALAMLVAVALLSLFPPMPDLARFAVMIVFGAGVGGHFGGALAMSMNYRAGKKYLSTDRPKTTEASETLI